MDILYLLIPLSVVLVFLIGAAFWWSVRSGQFDDLEGPAHRILADDDTATRSAGVADAMRIRADDAVTRSTLIMAPDSRPLAAAMHILRRYRRGRDTHWTTSVAAAATFNYKVVRQFTIMTVVWGIVGMLVGVIIAAQLLWPELNFDIPWLSYGRLRPLHTNAVIFAFGGSRAVRHLVLRRAAHLPGAAVLRTRSRRSRSGAGRRSSCWRRSRCRSATLAARNTPSSSGRSTS